jgi:hypothetical protein
LKPASFSVQAAQPKDFIAAEVCSQYSTLLPISLAWETFALRTKRLTFFRCATRVEHYRVKFDGIPITR